MFAPTTLQIWGDGSSEILLNRDLGEKTDKRERRKRRKGFEVGSFWVINSENTPVIDHSFTCKKNCFLTRKTIYSLKNYWWNGIIQQTNRDKKHSSVEQELVRLFGINKYN